MSSITKRHLSRRRLPALLTITAPLPNSSSHLHLVASRDSATLAAPRYVIQSLIYLQAVPQLFYDHGTHEQSFFPTRIIGVVQTQVWRDPGLHLHWHHWSRQLWEGPPGGERHHWRAGKRDSITPSFFPSFSSFPFLTSY